MSTDPATLVGESIIYKLNDADVEGRIVDWRFTGTTILDTTASESWPGIQFKIRTRDGAEFWTVTYAYKEGERS